MSDDVMQRLASIQPLPRGERLANIAGVFKMTEARRTLMLQWAWRTNALGSRSTVAAILWSLASRALNSENESVRNIARWRDYAAPLRKTREENRRLRAEILFVEDRALLFHGENEELRLENARLKNELARAILSASKENTK